MSSNAYVCISCFVVFYQIDTFPRHKWSMICVKPNRHTSASWMINVLRQLTFVNNDPEVQIQMRQLCLRFFAVHCSSLQFCLSFLSFISVLSQFCLRFVSVLFQFRLIFIWFSFRFLLSFVSFVSLLHLQISILCKSLEILQKKSRRGEKTRQSRDKWKSKASGIFSLPCSPLYYCYSPLNSLKGSYLSN